MAVLFDTLKLAERLEAAGMPPRQARDVASALAETASGDVATRQDIELLRRDIDQIRRDVGHLRETTQADIATLREYVDLRLGEMEARLRGEIHGGDAELRTEIAGLHTEIEKVRADVRGWLIAQAFAIIGAVAAIVGLAAALSRLIH
ncbi:MAG TPA: hypothetical protein VJ770_25515 [Stellaceae bacterium]|nr:hypothetical protein [Stellaceae bacterium]